VLRGNLCPHKYLPSQLDSVGFNRHFNKLPEDPQGNLAVREDVHLLPSEPDSVITTVNQILAGQQFNVKEAFVSTVSTPATSH